MPLGILAYVFSGGHKFAFDKTADDRVEVAGHVEHARQEQTLYFRVGQQQGKDTGWLVFAAAPLEDGACQPGICAEECVVELVNF